MKETAQHLTEALHLIRKHVIVSKRHGAAVTMKCLECGVNGANTPDEIKHDPDCRFAKLYVAVGGSVVYKKKAAKVNAPDLDACTS